MPTFPRDHFHNVKSEIVIFARVCRERRLHGNSSATPGRSQNQVFITVTA